MAFLRRYGSAFLLIGIVSDFLTPFVLGFFSPRFNQLTMLISQLGADDSPVRIAFNTWSIISGSLMLLSLPAVYRRIAEVSRPLARWSVIGIALFAVGDCIFTGIFSYEKPGQASIEGMIHSFTSGLGIVGFLIMPLLLAYFYSRENKTSRVRLQIFFFIFAGISSLIAGAPDLPFLDFTSGYDGLWQHINLIFLYLPVALFAGEELFYSERRIKKTGNLSKKRE